jgi:ketosteroid isomerase-like protein
LTSTVTGHAQNGCDKVLFGAPPTEDFHVSISDPAVLNERFNELFRHRNLEGMVALYEPTATVRLLSGEQISGHEQIRAYLSQLLALRGNLVATEQVCTQQDGLAILQASWHFAGEDPDGKRVELGGRSAKLARKAADGAWRYVIDA